MIPRGTSDDVAHTVSLGCQTALVRRGAPNSSSKSSRRPGKYSAPQAITPVSRRIRSGNTRVFVRDSSHHRRVAQLAESVQRPPGSYCRCAVPPPRSVAVPVLSSVSEGAQGRGVAMRTDKLLLIGVTVFATACGTSQTPAGTSTPATTAAPAQLGGAPKGGGTLTADAGEIQPVDPATFRKEPGYSPYAGRRYPERPVLRRRARAHGVVDGCRRLRNDARSGGSDAICTRRGSHVHERSAREARRGPGLGRHHRSLGWHGRDHRDQERQSRAPERPDHQEVARHVRGRACSSQGRGHGVDPGAGHQEAAAGLHGSQVRRKPVDEEHARSPKSTTSPDASRP